MYISTARNSIMKEICLGFIPEIKDNRKLRLQQNNTKRNLKYPMIHTGKIFQPVIPRPRADVQAEALCRRPEHRRRPPWRGPVPRQASNRPWEPGNSRALAAARCTGLLQHLLQDNRNGQSAGRLHEEQPSVICSNDH